MLEFKRKSKPKRSPTCIHPPQLVQRAELFQPRTHARRPSAV
jgi:hypothetical protein